MKEKKLYLECPYCKNNTLHRVLASHEYRSHFFYHDDEIEVTACDHFVACEGCNHTNRWGQVNIYPDQVNGHLRDK